jgi:DNA-binding transcriptional ArsR family regulator
MSPARIASTLFPAARLAMLRWLSDTEHGLHLRELERRSSLNKHGLSRELHALRNAGILMSRELGNQVIYRLNPECPIYDALRSIVRKTAGLAGGCVKRLSRWPAASISPTSMEIMREARRARTAMSI